MFHSLKFDWSYTILELSETARRDHSSESSFQFLRDEYNTQHTIGTYRKPFVSLADGYCMGGVSNSLRNLPIDSYCMGGVSNSLRNLPIDGYCMGGVSNNLRNL